jgi:hypothetical protein
MQVIRSHGAGARWASPGFWSCVAGCWRVAPPGLGTRAAIEAGPSHSVGPDVRFASCETGGVVDPPVVVMVGPKHPLSFGGVYEQPRAAR